jgi:hypothetical protein
VDKEKHAAEQYVIHAVRYGAVAQTVGMPVHVHANNDVDESFDLISHFIYKVW